VGVPHCYGWAVVLQTSCLYNYNNYIHVPVWALNTLNIVGVWSCVEIITSPCLRVVDTYVQNRIVVYRIQLHCHILNHRFVFVPL